jgi:hypothetical protein
MRAICIDSKDHRTDGTRCPGIIRRVVPRTVPRLQPSCPAILLLRVTSVTARPGRDGRRDVTVTAEGQSVGVKLYSSIGSGQHAGPDARGCGCRNTANLEQHLLPMTSAVWSPARSSRLARARVVPPLRITVSGYPRYSNAVRAVPSSEQRKIESVARLIVSSLSRGGPPVHLIRLHGHADADTPRRPSFEKRIGLARAQQIRNALSSAIDRIAASLPGPAPLPLYSSRIDWRISSAGASRPAAPNARLEAERARNRRVEILVYRHPASRSNFTRRNTFFEQAPDADMIDRIIQEFLDRIGDASIDRKNCFAAGSQVIQILKPGAPKNLRCDTRFAAQFAISKKYMAPFSQQVRCCRWNADCSIGANQKGCGQCSGLVGPYLILGYDARSLMRAVGRAKCVLDQGCVVRAGVLSGLCDDKPDLGCAEITPPKDVWRTCPEHWLLIIGYVGDTFVFWDSARTSGITRGGQQFGLLHYNRAENRLTTGQDLSKMEVNLDGKHTSNPDQKRYQVLILRSGGIYRPATRSC